MKRESLGWFVAGALAVLICTLGAMQQQGGVGRFQLLAGTYQINFKNTFVDVPGVWRIDTVTGETVQYLAVDNNGQPQKGWQSVTDF